MTASKSAGRVRTSCNKKGTWGRVLSFGCSDRLR